VCSSDLPAITVLRQLNYAKVAQIA
jgi:hypothetical protein